MEKATDTLCDRQDIPLWKPLGGLIISWNIDCIMDMLIYNIYIYIFNDRNRYILSSLGALAGIILATSWPRFGWWIPIDWLATTNFRLGPECHSAGDMISSISYFMGLLCFVFISVCFFNIRSRFIVLSGPCFMWHVFRNAELQRAGLHNFRLCPCIREVSPEVYVSLLEDGRHHSRWVMFFQRFFFKKNHFPEQCHSTEVKSNLSHGGVLCQRATQAGRSGWKSLRVSHLCCVDVPWGLPPPGSLERSHQIDHEEVEPRGGIWQQIRRETNP